MAVCCTYCSATALGTEVASICTECATANVAGASIGLPMLLAAAAAAGGGVIVLRVMRPRIGAWLEATRPAFA